MMSGSEPAAKLAGQQARQVRMTVQVAVAHATPVQNEAVVEQRAVAVLDRLHLLQEVAEQFDVVGVDLRLLLDQFGLAPVVRDGMVPLGHADLRERQRTEFAAHDHAGDARHVGLVCQHLQVEHHPGVFVPRIGNVGWPVG